MQGKGILKFFLILLAIVSAVQILYFIPTNKVEKNAEEYANARASRVGEASQSFVRKTARAEFLDSMSSEVEMKHTNHNILKRQPTQDTPTRTATRTNKDNKHFLPQSIIESRGKGPASKCQIL